MRAVTIQLEPGETEVHVVIKAAAPVVVKDVAPERPPMTEVQLAAHRALNISDMLHGVFGSAATPTKAAARKLHSRLKCSSAQMPYGDSVLRRRALVDVLRNRKDAEVYQRALAAATENLAVIFWAADLSADAALYEAASALAAWVKEQELLAGK